MAASETKKKREHMNWSYQLDGAWKETTVEGGAKVKKRVFPLPAEYDTDRAWDPKEGFGPEAPKTKKRKQGIVRNLHWDWGYEQALERRGHASEREAFGNVASGWTEYDAMSSILEGGLPAIRGFLRRHISKSSAGHWTGSRAIANLEPKERERCFILLCEAELLALDEEYQLRPKSLDEAPEAREIVETYDRVLKANGDEARRFKKLVRAETEDFRANMSIRAEETAVDALLGAPRPLPSADTLVMAKRAAAHAAVEGLSAEALEEACALLAGLFEKSSPAGWRWLKERDLRTKHPEDGEHFDKVTYRQDVFYALVGKELVLDGEGGSSEGVRFYIPDARLLENDMLIILCELTEDPMTALGRARALAAASYIEPEAEDAFTEEDLAELIKGDESDEGRRSTLRADIMDAVYERQRIRRSAEQVAENLKEQIEDINREGDEASIPARKQKGRPKGAGEFIELYEMVRTLEKKYDGIEFLELYKKMHALELKDDEVTDLLKEKIEHIEAT